MAKETASRHKSSALVRSASALTHVVRAHQEITSKNIELVLLTSDNLDAAADLRTQYEALNVFDGVHLGSAAVLDEPIVSTDTLFPEIPEIEHIDPRNLE
jgi:predicted nucleic acid-binding protein